MLRKLLIVKREEKILTALVENERIVEIHPCEDTDQNSFRIGNIYIGKVKKVAANIGAAFIEISPGVECYYAIDEKKRPVKPGMELVVQIEKEAVKTKVPTVTDNLSFQGKYLVLTSGKKRLGVSSKIKKEERERLTQCMDKYITPEYGFIVRTNASGMEETVLYQEAENLIREFEVLREKASTRTCFSVLKEAERPYLTEIRNLYQDGLSEIVIEDEVLYEEALEFLKKEQPEDAEKLKKYEDKLLPLHKLYNVDGVLEKALQEKVWMKSGAYLVIQPTEALTVIDVNTGKCVQKKKDDDTYYKINMEAAKEAAYQIRLRNLSGIVLIDFVNLDSKEQTAELLEMFQKELWKDPIPTKLVDMTKLQLVEVTRKKVRKPLKESVKHG